MTINISPTMLVLFTVIFADGLSAQNPSSIWEPKPTTVAKMRGQAQAYKHVPVRFVGQFESVGTLHNPFFTRFTRASYANFAVWGDEQRLWLRKDYNYPLASIFCAKTVNSTVLETLYQLRRFQRVEIVGMVRNIFQGEPWIEATSITPLDGKVTVSTLHHLNKATELMQKHKWGKAGVEIGLAITEDLPGTVQGWIQAYMGECFMKLGRPDSARAKLETAMELLPDEPSIARMLRLIDKDPKGAIDTEVLEGTIPKDLRPMWIAWEATRKKAARSKRTGKPDRKPTR